jgi:hypothetical protein
MQTHNTTSQYCSLKKVPRSEGNVPRYVTFTVRVSVASMPMPMGADRGLARLQKVTVTSRMDVTTTEMLRG